MNLATGEVLTDTGKGHTGTDELRSFKRIAAVPRGPSVHTVLDNLSAHSAPEVTRWLAHPGPPPLASISWLNLIDRWFSELTDTRLRRVVFTSVAELAGVCRH